MADFPAVALHFMSLFVTSLASGSNGNCYYIGNATEAILVDVGITCLEVERRMKRLGLSMQKLRAVFISHEHADHIRGISVLTKKYGIPAYITQPTLRKGGLRIEKELINSFEAYKQINIGSLSVTPFPKLHDASDPFSFIVHCNEVKVGIFTDIGTPCDHVINHFKQCHAAFLEANYDEEMLENGNYPYYLKTRIRGGHGHLSNRQALALFQQHRPSYMSHLFLAHLSKNNNCPKLVNELFHQHANGVNIIIASRFEETPVYHIEISAGVNKKRVYTSVSQLQFSF